MAEQTKSQKSRDRRSEEQGQSAGDQETTSGTTALAERGEEIKNRLDGILDEIDQVLEENAQEFVASYVQRGGE
jgi:prokaryotic ubiquitin-like protein Pup